MIENKFVYFKTRKAFESERDSGHINYDSIVFVEEGRTIYTHGTEFGVSQVQNNITNLNLIVLDVSEELRKKIQDAIEQLLKENDKTGNDALSGIDGIDKKIEDLKKQLDALDKSKGTKGEISLLDGRIQAYTDYINKLYQTITKWYQDINAELGKMVTNGELVDYVNDRYNKYMKEVDLKDAALREELSTGNTDGLVDTVVGRIMDADEGIFSNYVEKTTYNLDKEAILTQIGNIAADAGTVTLEAIRNILDGDTEKTIAAKIFLDANGEESTIKLNADKIDMTGAEETAVGRFIADLINAKEISTNTLHVEDSDHNTIDINNTVGIKGVTASDNSVEFHLKTDGSGELAKGNIKWDKDGNLNIKNLTVEGTTFASEEGNKVFSITEIYDNVDGVFFDYAITSSGVLLKSGRMILYTPEEVLENNNNVPGIDSFNPEDVHVDYLYKGLLIYLNDEPTYHTITLTANVDTGIYKSLYNCKPVVVKATWSENMVGTTYDNGNETIRTYAMKRIPYRCTTASGILTFLAQRLFKYPGGSSKMPDVKASRGYGDYWTYTDVGDPRLYTEPIYIDPQDRNFVNTYWKEIFSVPTEDTVTYPDGRKWLIEDGEKISVFCVDHFIQGPYSEKDGKVISNFQLEWLESYDTESLRQDAIHQYEVSCKKSEYVGFGGNLITIPRSGNGHIKFKRNPYEFYENAPAPFVPNPTPYKDETDYSAQIAENWDYIPYCMHSLTVDEGRFGWETW